MATTEPSQHVDRPADGPAEFTVDETLDSDSAYADETASYTTSLRSSVLEYREEYGRRYHSYREGRHFLPNDEQEQERLDVHHVLILALLHGALHLAPLQDPRRVLDLGTGTGVWAIDFADAYPSAHVIGNDLSPIQPTYTPSNVEFIVDDIEDSWNYENNPFDFVHARYLAGSIRDWPALARQAYSSIKPGGWVELQDWDCMVESHDNSIPEDSVYWQWHKECTGRMAKEANARPGPGLEKWVKDAGFVNVHVEKLPIPMGTWPKDQHLKKIGFLNRMQLERGLEAVTIGCLSRQVSEAPAWTMDEIKVLLTQFRKDIYNHQYHGQFSFYVVYGQKPESS